MLSELAGWDADNVRESRRRHKKWLAVLESALDVVIEGFEVFARRGTRPQSETERARISLTVRAFRSVHVSLVVAQMGYYHQAIMLARAAMEDLIMAEVAHRHPPVLEALNSEDTERAPRFGRGELTIEKLTDMLPADFKPIWKDEYSNASKLGSHPGGPSLDTQLVLDGEGTPHLPLYGHQDNYLAAACFGFIAGRCRRIIYVLGLLNDEETAWTEDGQRTMAKIDEMMKEVVEELKEFAES